MFAVLIPILAGLDIVLKYAVNSMDKKELPRIFAKKIEIDKFHNDGFAFGKLKKKKKIVLNKVKNSLSIILGYSEAHNDGMISKNDMDEKINEEIAEIVAIIKEEIYK